MNQRTKKIYGLHLESVMEKNKIEFITNTEDQVNALMMPGVVRALYSYNHDGFSCLWRSVLRQALGENNEPSSASHCKLLGHILREFNHDHVNLKVRPESSSANMSFMERKRLENSFDVWRYFEKIINNKALNEEDWFSVFKTISNSIEGQERKFGASLVKAAFKHPDRCIRAIELFPKVFRRARELNTEVNAVNLLAGNFDWFEAVLELQTSKNDPSYARKQTFLVLNELKKTGLRINSDSLITATMFSVFPKRQFIFEAFKDFFGKEKMLNARDCNNMNALHRSLIIDDSFTYVEKLIEYGFDCMEKDNHNRFPLEVAIRNANGKTSTVLLIMRETKDEKLINQVIDLASTHPHRIGNEAIRSLLLAEGAKRAIFNAMESKTVTPMSS